MYCRTCGEDLGSYEDYCHNCGTPLIESYTPREAQTPLLIVKPRFASLLSLISLLPLQFIFTIWGATVFGIMGFFLAKYMEWEIHPWFFAIFFGVLFFIFTPIVLLISKMNKYAKTEYRFYKNKLDYHEGIFSVDKRHISYDNIFDITLHRGSVQKAANLGTIILSVAGLGRNTALMRGAIHLTDIEYPEVIYRRIRDIIDNTSRTA